MSNKFLALFFKAIRKGDINTVRAALTEGADSNSRDEHHLTALMWAARSGHFDVFSELLRSGADLIATDKTKRTFLHHCVLFKKHDFLTQVLELPGIPLHTPDMHGFTALDVAIADNNRRCADLLERAGAKSKLTSRAKDPDGRS